MKASHVWSHGPREAHGTHLCRPGPWAGPGVGMALKNKPCGSPYACSGCAGILPASKLHIFFVWKNRDLQEKAPCRARPRRRGKTTALVVLLSTVVHGTHVVGPIMFGGGGVKRLRRFSGVSQAFLPVF